MSALTLIGSIGLMIYVKAREPVPPEVRPKTVTGLLRQFKCRSSETKKVIIRGIEDHYSPVGSEPNFLRSERQSVAYKSFFAGGSYDQMQDNRRFTDSFRTPTNLADGLFVIKMRPIGNIDTDTIGIGDLKHATASSGIADRFSLTVVALDGAEGWSRDGDLYMASLGDIRLIAAWRDPAGRPKPSLLDFIRSGASDGWIDVVVQDDSAVDVMGVAVCVEPPRGKGLSLAAFAGPPPADTNIVALSCAHGDGAEPMCNAYVGDTACSVPQPIACILPQGAPVPKSLEGHFAKTSWSGGKIAFTPPVRGDRFRTIGAVDAHCAARFGPSWRTAEHHDGMTYYGISGFGDRRRTPNRAWIDIKDQPYATCWAR